MRLLEREAQRAALAQYAGEAGDGHGRLVLVAGEAGVGKSSLLERLQAELPGARWCWGGCDGLFTPRPLAPLLDIAGALGGELAELCRVGAPRDELFAALLRQLDRPDVLTVLAVEDVHWADEATLDLLRFTGRRIRSARALMLVSYRDDGLAGNDRLQVALGELTTQRHTRRLDVPPLSPEAVGLLAEGSGVEPGELYRLTGGNPFYVTEVLRDGSAELPTSARDAVLARAARLRGEARAVLDAAALIGSKVEPGLLAAVTGEPPGTVDEVVAGGILTGDGDRLRFRHEIARLAVEQGIAAHRRAPIHRRILDALRATGCDDAARLAFHAEAAADGELVLLHAPVAARVASELGSHREAAAQYQRALRFSAGTDVLTRASLYEALAIQMSLVDRWQECADACGSALALWREVDDPLRAGGTLGLLSRAMWRLCRGAEAHRAAEDALAVLEPLGSTPELARALVNLAGTRMEESRHTEAIELARRARALAEQWGLPDVLSDALNTEGCASADIGGDWRELLDRALEVAVATGLEAQAGRAFANSYALHCSFLSFATGERYFVDGIAYSDEHDIGTFGTCLRGQRTQALARTGGWAEAAGLAASLLALPAVSPVNRLNPLMSLGSVRARRGDAGVWDCLDEAVASSDRLDEPLWIVAARTAAAEARWLERDLVAAEEDIAKAEKAVPPGDALAASEVAVWRYRIDRTRTSGVALVEPFASEVAGDHAEAARRWDDLGCPYDAALALLGSTDEGLLREALARLDDLGAVAAVRVARQRLRDVGVRSVPSGARPSTREHPAGLTQREREVLELLCGGHTNDEIAGRLFISRKTVDHHVSAVLHKLGVPSRRVAATEAVRLGLVAGART